MDDKTFTVVKVAFATAALPNNHIGYCTSTPLPHTHIKKHAEKGKPA